MYSIPVWAIQYWVHQNTTPCSNTTTQLFDLAGIGTLPYVQYPCLGYTVLSSSEYNKPCSNTTTQLFDLAGIGTLPYVQYPCLGYTVLSSSEYNTMQ